MKYASTKLLLSDVTNNCVLVYFCITFDIYVLYTTLYGINNYYTVDGEASN